MNKEDPMPFRTAEPDAPLVDFRVLDLSSPVGVYRTRLLADLGDCIGHTCVVDCVVGTAGLTHA